MFGYRNRLLRHTVHGFSSLILQPGTGTVHSLFSLLPVSHASIDSEITPSPHLFLVEVVDQVIGIFHAMLPCLLRPSLDRSSSEKSYRRPNIIRGVRRLARASSEASVIWPEHHPGRPSQTRSRSCWFFVRYFITSSTRVSLCLLLVVSYQVSQAPGKRPTLLTRFSFLSPRHRLQRCLQR